MPKNSTGNRSTSFSWKVAPALAGIGIPRALARALGTTFVIHPIMKNPFHQIETLIQTESTDPRDGLRALLATIYLDCCEECSAKLRSDEFLEAFSHMLKEMKLCRELTSKNAA
jgi:hypothetical protein